MSLQLTQCRCRWRDFLNTSPSGTTYDPVHLNSATATRSKVVCMPAIPHSESKSSGGGGAAPGVGVTEGSLSASSSAKKRAQTLNQLPHGSRSHTRSDTVRARVAAGFFERIAEWNGYGRVLLAATAGVEAHPEHPPGAAKFSSGSLWILRRAEPAAGPQGRSALELVVW